jgi:hypothetical protein
MLLVYMACLGLCPALQETQVVDEPIDEEGAPRPDYESRRSDLTANPAFIHTPQRTHHKVLFHHLRV